MGLEVIAHYTTDSADYPTMDIKLNKNDATGYKVIYGSSDGKLHVNNPGITVTYTYRGVTKTERLTLTVNPKSLDEEMEANGVTFEDTVVKYDGTAKEIGEVKGKDLIPDHALAMCSSLLCREAFATEEISYKQAITYLRKEAITLPVTAPRGYVLLTYRHIPLGFVKNIGNRANNLYPQEWRIRSGYLPENIRILAESTVD